VHILPNLPKDLIISSSGGLNMDVVIGGGGERDEVSVELSMIGAP
jgi:hypothetical protein